MLYGIGSREGEEFWPDLNSYLLLERPPSQPHC